MSYMTRKVMAHLSSQDTSLGLASAPAISVHSASALATSAWSPVALASQAAAQTSSSL